MDKAKTAAEIIRDAEAKLKQVAETEKMLRMKSREAQEKLKMADKLEELLEDKRLAKKKLIKFKVMIAREIAYAKEAAMAIQQQKPTLPLRPPAIQPMNPAAIAALVATTTAAIAPLAVEIAQLDSMLKEFNETNQELQLQAQEQYGKALQSISNECIEEGELKFKEALEQYGPEKAEEIRQTYQAVAASILSKETFEMFQEKHPGIDASEIWSKYNFKAQEAMHDSLNRLHEIKALKDDFTAKHNTLYQDAMDRCEAITNEFIEKASPPEIEMDANLKQTINTLKTEIAEQCLNNNLEMICPDSQTTISICASDASGNKQHEILPSEIKVGDTLILEAYVENFDQYIDLEIGPLTEVLTAGDIVVLKDEKHCFTNLDITQEFAAKKLEIEQHNLQSSTIDDPGYEIGRK